jgi:predicted hydrocarbon binding protein
VLRETDNPVNYARALIHIAEQQQFTRLAPGAVGSRKDQFYSRIKRILNYNTMKTNMRDKILSLSLLAGSIILLLTISGFSAGPSFFRIDKMHGENMYEPADPIEIVVQDTIREDSKHAHLEALEEIEEIDWEEMKVEIEAAHLEALEEIEEIDWEEVREEMRQSFSEMKLDMQEVKREIEISMNEIDWDEIRADIKEDMENIRLSLDSIKIEMDL